MMAKLIKGVNDIATLYPKIAKQAYGWDPATKTKGSSEIVLWQCQDHIDHIYDMAIYAKIGQNQGCPFCSNQRVLPGFNDLATVNPDLAKEAHGWDPSTVLPGSGKKMLWQCPIDARHIYPSSPSNRAKSGCSICSGRYVLAGVNDLATTHPKLQSKHTDGTPKLKQQEQGRRSTGNANPLAIIYMTWQFMRKLEKNLAAPIAATDAFWLDSMT